MKDNSDTQWKMRLQLRHNEYCSCSYTVPRSDQNVPGSDVPSSDLLRVAIRYYWIIGHTPKVDLDLLRVVQFADSIPVDIFYCQCSTRGRVKQVELTRPSWLRPTWPKAESTRRVNSIYFHLGPWDNSASGHLGRVNSACFYFWQTVILCLYFICINML